MHMGHLLYTDCTGRDVTQESQSLASFPLALISDHPPRLDDGDDPNTYTWQQPITIAGDHVDQVWEIQGSSKLGLPRGIDSEIVFGLSELYFKGDYDIMAGIETGTLYRQLKVMGYTIGGSPYAAFRTGVSRLLAASYHTHYALWSEEHQQLLPEFEFNIISHAEGHTAPKNTPAALQKGKPVGRVYLTPRFCELLQSGQLKATNATFYRSLPRYAKRLYQLLDVFRRYRKAQWHEAFVFAKRLGHHDITLKRYRPQKLRDIQTPHLETLVARGYLENFSWRTTGGRTRLGIKYAGDHDNWYPLSPGEATLVERIVTTFKDSKSRRYYEKVVKELGVRETTDLLERVNTAAFNGSIERPGALFSALAQPRRREMAKSRGIRACGVCHDDGFLHFRQHHTRQLLRLPCDHNKMNILRAQAQRLDHEIILPKRPPRA